MPIRHPPIVARALGCAQRPALVTRAGTVSYGELLSRSATVAAALLDGRRDLEEARVAFLTEPGVDYVCAQWGIWQAGGIAVPLAVSHPVAELEHVVADADAAVIAADQRFLAHVQPLAATLGCRLLLIDGIPERATVTLPDIDPDRRAMIVYTSGTTGRSKGVVTTHRNIEAQITSLVAAWEWRPTDRTLLVLPLHHIHGIINVLGCALWSGAMCEVMSAFDASEVWHVFESATLTLFMAVPTIYRKLIDAWELEPPERRAALSASCRRMRLMVSGSAALPVTVLERWKEVSGHTLLERYGMTEIGMALANPIHGERRPGHVGLPLPNVEVKLSGDGGADLPPGTPGEILVRGPGVFREYWRQPEATAVAFQDGWFKTGDVALLDRGSYRILGRRSVDIIKTGGYKVSALEIEDVLRDYPHIRECAVVGIPDEEWGERLCAAIEPVAGHHIETGALREWARERLAPYKIPRRVSVVSQLPRNAMGKVLKPEIVKLFQTPVTPTETGSA